MNSMDLLVKSIAFTGVTTDGVILTPTAGKRLNVKSITVSKGGTAANMIVSRGADSATTNLIDLLLANQYSLDYGSHALRMAVDQTLEFTGGIITDSVQVVVHYYETD